MTRKIPYAPGCVDATEESVAAWIKAGAAALGIGGNLTARKLLRANDYAGISTKVKQVMG
jgi:2-dehydro-3-deoxyphosphogluconate aldolase/(4S)-4-hydroxy-2-oxoglutarate aldolase